MIAALSSVSAADFFPLQPGNLWIYRTTSTGETLTVRVGTPVFLNRQVYYSLRGYTPQPILVRLNEQRDLVTVDEETYREEPVTMFSTGSSAGSGAWWDAPARGCDQQGRTLDARGIHDGPAGPFQDVLEIAYRTFVCADVGVESEQYAENIGMVRRVNSTIAGPRSFDLVYARVGHLEIEASPRGGFSLSLQDAGENLAAILRLRIDPPASIRLAFPTGQQFDVALEDDAGNVLWKWSDGKVFTQSLQDLTIGDGWTIPVSIPRPVQPGSYVIRAWITTASPSFAASVPLTVPAPDGEAK